MKKAILDQAAYEALDPALQADYAKRDSDGKWVFQIEGMVPMDKHAEFRESNRALKLELDAFKALGEITELADLKAKEADIKAGRISGGKTVKELVEEQVGAQKAASEKLTKELAGKLDASKAELAKLKIGEAAVKIAAKHGLKAEAHEFFLYNVNQVMSLDENGLPVAKTPTGEVIYGKNAEPLGMEELVEGMVTKHPVLWEASGGTGATGGNGRRGVTPGINPYKKETFNLTKQGELETKDLAMAQRLAREAGVRV